MKIFDYVRNALFLVAIVIILGAAGCYFLKIKPAVVLSGSMEPAFRTGSVVFVDTKAADKVGVGDAIAFYVADEYLTHRIVDETEDTFITKGDANSTIDPWRVAKPGSKKDNAKHPSIDGKCIFSIPLLGYVFAFAKSKVGIIIIVTLAICLVLSMFLVPVKMPERKKKTTDERLEESYVMLKEEYESLDKKYRQLKSVCAELNKENGLFEAFDIAEKTDYEKLYERYMQVLELLENKNILAKGFKDREETIYKREITSAFYEDESDEKPAVEDKFETITEDIVATE